MKAIIYSEYGSPEVLQLKDLEKPVPKDTEVLVRIKATSLNSSDYEFLTGKPVYTRMWGLRKPKNTILGSDIAGIVEACGIEAKKFQPADAVFGDIFERWGGLAEYVCVPENMLQLKPDFLTFEQAAAIPQAACIALHALQNIAQVQSGQKVLINGAGGGAGSFSIQIAKLLGAHVTGVDNERKLDFMKSIGADQVIDYVQQDFTKNGNQYDFILDFVASHTIMDYSRSLKKGGKYLMVGGSVPHVFQTLIIGSFISLLNKKKMGLFAAKPNLGMDLILKYIRDKKTKPFIDKTFTLKEAPDAFHYLGNGHAKGKIVISM